MAYAENRPSIRLLVGFASCLLVPALPGQPLPADPNSIRSVHPVSDAADRLRKNYGMVITYEDPLWEWPGEMIPLSSKVNPDTKGGWTPDWVTFTMPATAAAIDLPARLAQVLAGYHQQTGGPHFQVLTSKLGLHIVPTQVRDREGRLAPAQNPFDKPVFIARQERTAHQHLTALGSALQAGTVGLKIDVSPRVVDLRGDSFNFMFAPTRVDDHPFVWGTPVPNMTARDALIDLLDHSATTFYWDMRCLGTASARYDICYVKVAPLEVATGPGGNPVNAPGKILKLTNGKQMKVYDRCGGCEGGRVLTHLEQNREKKP